MEYAKLKCGLSQIMVLSLVMTMSACGLIKDRSGEYVDADPGKRIVIPQGYSDLKIGSRYPIPHIESSRVLDQGAELPRPPNATAALSTEPYLVETVGEQTWLRLYSSPGKVWPLLDFFWQDQGIDLREQQIQQGYVITRAVPLDSPLYRLVQDNSRQSLEAFALHAKLVQGVRRNTAELQLRIVQPGAGAGVTNALWAQLDAQPQLEAALLTSIGEFTSSDALRNRHSLLANDISSEPRVFMLEDDSGDSYLKLKLNQLRAWNEVGKALTAAKVLVSDIDQSQGTYFVSYLREEELGSWFLTEARRANKLTEQNYSVRLIPSEPASIDVFEVRVEALNDKVESEHVHELLSLIFEHIS